MAKGPGADFPCRNVLIEKENLGFDDEFDRWLKRREHNENKRRIHEAASAKLINERDGYVH
jgi:hypothetical protein